MDNTYNLSGKFVNKLSIKDEDSGIAEDIEDDDDVCSEGEELYERQCHIGWALPEELWVKIFSFFTEYELCSVGLTCKRFLELTRDPSLWRKIKLVGDAISSTECVEKLLRRCHQVHDIRVSSRDDIIYLIDAISQSCKQLETLEMKYCPPLLYTDLAKLANSCTKLKALNLEGTGVLNADGDVHEMEGSNTCACGDKLSFGKLFSGFKSLESLNLFLSKNLHSKGLELLAEGCTNLTSLNIDEINYLSNQSFIRLIELRGPQLLELRIDGESLCDESFKHFDRLSSLKLLTISFADYMGPLGLQAITSLHNLEWLKIRRGAELEAAHFVSAFRNVNLRKLSHLNLSECSKLDDEGLSMIASHCTGLQEVWLNWCWEVSDLGISHLVSSCPGLWHLNLCGVVRLLGDFIPSGAPALPSLKFLDLEQCPDVPTHLLEDLVRRNLRLVVKNYYGETVGPGDDLKDIIESNPDISFVSFDHEDESCDDERFINVTIDYN